MSWLLVCGLEAERRRIDRRQPGVQIIAGGGQAERLAHQIGRHLTMSPSIVLSTGIAGALDPALQVGDVVIDGQARLASRLRAAWPRSVPGAIHGQDVIAATAVDKARLRAATAALAVDMESHVARAVAARYGVPFAALRVISDVADESLPPAALVGMKPDGGMALGAVLGSLARQPVQLPALIRTGINAGKAMRVLGRVHHALERSGVFGLDLREFPLDVG